MRFFKLILLVLAPLILINCQQKKSRPATTKILVKGDPIAFVDGTAMSLSPIPKTFFDDVSGFELSVTVFTEESQDVEYVDVVKDQDPSTADAGASVQTYTMLKRGDGSVAVSGPGITLVYEDSGKGYVLDRLESSGETVSRTSGDDVDSAFKNLHQSVHVSKAAASSLIYYGSKGARSLANIVLIKSTKKKVDIPIISGPYNYLFGKGKKMKWDTDKPIDVRVCAGEGSPHDVYASMVSDAAAAWNAAGGGKFKLVTGKEVACPPFSDLNSKTFMFVDRFVEFPDEDLAMKGSTLVSPNISAGTFIDGDIFVLKKEIEDGWGVDMNSAEFLKSTEGRNVVGRTVIHEMGHLLGLHHQFEPAYRSIMSYDGNVVQIQAHDREAIQKLYSK